MTRAVVSFEFFPPKTDKMAAKLWEAVKYLEPLNPAFVSVTYGAGGSTRERTHATVRRIASETSLPCAAHLTCVDATREEVDKVAQAYWSSGIQHIVALRGDPPESEGQYRPAEGGYTHASDLVAGLCRVADFEISVAAYPEVHPEAANAVADLNNLKRKLDAGAVRAVTQFFFDNELYLRFRDRAAATGITAPIVPGIMPVTNLARIQSFAQSCGAKVPKEFAAAFDGLDDDPAGRHRVATNLAVSQCLGLLDEGVHEFHFYTLNRADLTTAICARIGVLPQELAV